MLLYWLFLLGTIVTKATPVNSVSVVFYSEILRVNYHLNMLLDVPVEAEENSIFQYYENLRDTDYQIIIEDLKEKKAHFQLNDWLYYDLMTNCIDQIFVDKSVLQKTLTCWFLLSESGFDTRLTYINNTAYVNVYTEDALFEVPMVQENGRNYVNLTNIQTNQGRQSMLYMLDFVPNPSGHSFSFDLIQLPRLQPQFDSRNLTFRNDKHLYHVQVQTDRTIMELMKNYPFIAEEKYLHVPFSPTLANSLLPQLREKIANKTEAETLQFLVAFTRSAFEYKDDKAHFGKSKPMIADEVFHYNYSDCEDRSALFFTLVKELLDLPMLIVAFPDHLSIAVATELPSKPAIFYNGKKYYLCDPTGPVNSNAIGDFPEGFEKQPFEILGNYGGNP